MEPKPSTDDVRILSQMSNFLADPKNSCSLAVAMQAFIMAPQHRTDSAKFCLALQEMFGGSCDESTPNQGDLDGPQLSAIRKPQSKISKDSARQPDRESTLVGLKKKASFVKGVEDSARQPDRESTLVSLKKKASFVKGVAQRPSSAGARRNKRKLTRQNTKDQIRLGISRAKTNSALDVSEMQIIQEKMDRLKNMPLLAGVPYEQLHVLVSQFKKHRFDKGQELMTEGAEINDESQFYFVDSGLVDIYIDGVKVVTREPGSYFGETGLLEEQPRSATVIAATELVCLCLSRSDFSQLAKTYPEIRKAFNMKMRGIGNGKGVERVMTAEEIRKEIARIQERNAVSQYLSENLNGKLRFSSKCLIFRPEHLYRMGWDVYVMSLTLYYAFAVPLQLGFRQEPQYPSLDHLFTACFAVDLLVTFNTALIGQGGMLIYERKRIANEYLRPYFFVDAIATFPFEVISEKAVGSSDLPRVAQGLRLLRIMKLLHILKLPRILRRLKHSTNVNPNWYLLGRTVAVMVFTFHFTACGYWAVVENQPEDSFGRLYSEEDEMWAPPSFIREASFSDQYAYAFFWGISVTTGVGWDIVPATGPEVAYCLCVLSTSTHYACSP
jgi:CRP-like cAMP-binding protein